VIPRVIPRLIPGEENSAAEAAAVTRSVARRPLEQLLHALNQPLTGLQCSMEVALASPRTPEQYVRGLREGLELTERMRALVEAIREVVEAGEEKKDNREKTDHRERKEEKETIELEVLLREVAAELAPVAEAKSVRITLESTAASLSPYRHPHPHLRLHLHLLSVMGERRRLEGLAFRFLESVVSLAARGSPLRIETGGEPARAWVRIRWCAGRPRAEFSRPELGLLVAQAGWERLGAQWMRERIESLETVTVRLTACADPDCSQPDYYEAGEAK
jgi:signal transduction histidine kinase